MKFIVGAVFILGVILGSSGMRLDFSLDSVARHECDQNKKGTVVLLSTLYVEDPLSQNTCGDLHRIDAINF